MRIPICVLLLTLLGVHCHQTWSFGQADCAAPLPVPTGTTMRPLEVFSMAEYFQTTGCVPLQGNLAKEKYAPILFSTSSGGVANFETDVVVNNISSQGNLSVEIEMLDSAGMQVDLMGPIDIPPNGHFQQKLWRFEPNVFGMVCVRVLPGSEVRNFVGATVYSADAFTNPFDSSLDFFETETAMASAQPLQQLQRGDTPGIVHLGPFAATLDLTKEVLNGNFALVNILNPSNRTVELTATISSDNGPQNVITIPPIPPRGSTQFFGLWLRAIANYLTGQPAENLTLTLTERTGKPFIAEGLVFDLLSNDDIVNGSGIGGGPGGGGGSGSGSGSGSGGTSPLVGDPTVGTLPYAEDAIFASILASYQNWNADSGPTASDIDPQLIFNPAFAGGRGRMTSIMGAYTQKRDLVSTELTDLGDGLHGTVVGVANVGSEDATQVIAWYYDMDGNLLGTDRMRTLEPFDVFQIGLNCPDSPNFPTAGVFRGWMRITSCSGSLVGFSTRFNENDGTSQKMWGELLHGNGGEEHGPGWIEGRNRNILAPFVFDQFETVESNHVQFLNNTVGNIGTWSISIFDEAGNSGGSASFRGLRASNTAGSYLDGFDANLGNSIENAKIRNRFGSVKGVNTIGPVEGVIRFEPSVWKGPGDTVGPHHPPF